MNRDDLINGLWRIAKPDPNKCDGYAYENNCSMRGCAIIRAAVLEIEILSASNNVLKESRKVQYE